MRVLNAAYVPSALRLEEVAYKGYWPYQHSTIGSMEDLEAARLEWVKSFHDAYYAPNNAVLAISGDFDPDRAMDLVKKYFGDARPQANLPKYAPGPLAEQAAARTEAMEDPHARLPMLRQAWIIPPNREPDHYALELAALLLADGESSRLYKLLVRDKGLAVTVDAGTNDYRGPDAFEIESQTSEKGTIAQVAKIVDDEIAALGRTGPTDAEMTKVKNRLSSRVLFGLQSNYARAERLAAYELFYGDAGIINTELDKFLAVTKDDVKRAVAKHLTAAHRTQIDVKPEAKPEAKSDAKGGAKPAATPPAKPEAAKPATTPAKNGAAK